LNPFFPVLFNVCELMLDLPFTRDRHPHPDGECSYCRYRVVVAARNYRIKIVFLQVLPFVNCCSWCQDIGSDRIGCFVASRRRRARDKADVAPEVSARQRHAPARWTGLDGCSVQRPVWRMDRSFVGYRQVSSMASSQD
jgi:hypothetical protein